MTDVQWVKVKSWHVVAHAINERHSFVTLCGKTADGPALDRRPAREKSCENCLRIATKDD